MSLGTGSSRGRQGHKYAPHRQSQDRAQREHAGWRSFPLNPPASVAAVPTPGKLLCCWISKTKLKNQKRGYSEWSPLWFHSIQWVGRRLQTLPSELSWSVKSAFCFSILGTNLHSTILTLFGRWFSTSTIIVASSNTPFSKNNMLHRFLGSLKRKGWKALHRYNVQMKARTFAIQIHPLYRDTCTTLKVTSRNKHIN